ncbi:MAG: T9SS type A sorting domain-containing protein [Bacteroidales bacterium]|nr:T9SS type A sorting domain-containing protein [Bacteroidales bacterium]NLP20505.1 T9SS type A sorting domain-containing protein [Bacteroidales bacterium]
MFNFVVLKKGTIIVYPNPFTDFIHIDLPASADNCEIRVFDLMGKLIYSKKTHSNNTPLNLSQLVSGTYLIQIQTKQNIFSKRIVKN